MLIMKKLRQAHVSLKIFLLFGILASLAGFLFWISFQTGNSLICQGCWELSLSVSLGALILYSAACLFLFDKSKSRIGATVIGLGLFWLVLRVVESDSALLGIFINADPFLYKQEVILNPKADVQVTDMDTSHVFGIPPEAYMVNIKRWDMVRYLKGQAKRKGSSGQ